MADDITRMEAYLRRQYSAAQKDVAKKMRKYLQKFKELDKKKRAAVDSGKMTEEEYATWRRNKLLYGLHWKRLEENITNDLTRTNEMAVDYINGQISKIFINAYNGLQKDIPPSYVEGYSFELINSDTVEQLVKSKEIILPPPKDINKYKDKLWNKKKVNSAVLQGILQGESMDAIAERVAKATKETNYAAAIRNARTMVTAAENSGRAAGIKRAEQDGVILDKIWRATSDSRTRDSHAAMDGERIPSEKKFSNGLMFPGDWSTNNPAEVYNCRCTLITKFVSFDNKRFKDSRGYSERVKAKEEEKPPVNPFTFALAKLRSEFKNETDIQEKEQIVNQAGNVMREEYMKRFEEWNENTNALSQKYYAELGLVEQELEKLENDFVEYRRLREIYRVNGDGLKVYELEKYIMENRDKYSELNDKRLLIYDEFNAIIEKEKEKLADMSKAFIAEVRKCGYGSVSPTDLFFPATLDQDDKHMFEVVSKCMPAYPTDWIEGIQNNKAIYSHKFSKIQIGKNDRGHYSPGLGEIMISGENEKEFIATGYHELAHYIEDNIENVREIDKAFYRRRTQGCKLEKLNEVTSLSYDDNEYTKVDNFIDAYMGKYYTNDSFEVLSMGFESFFTDPTRIMSDEDYFNHVLGVLAIC